jgi:hypothetical protein
MKRAICFTAAILLAGSALAANGPPLASSWNIATAGDATSSGDLDFRITPNDGSDPVDITVPVISGASQDSVARSIGRSLSSQLRRDRYNVQVGEGANVMVSDSRGQPNFSLELVDSTIENVRVTVRSAEPVAPPTVPAQSTPANSPAIPATPPAPGDTVPPASNSAPPSSNTAPPASSSAPPASSSAPPASNSAPPANSSSPAGAGASAPPPR